MPVSQITTYNFALISGGGGDCSGLTEWHLVGHSKVVRIGLCVLCCVCVGDLDEPCLCFLEGAEVKGLEMGQTGSFLESPGKDCCKRRAHPVREVLQRNCGGPL